MLIITPAMKCLLQLLFALTLPLLWSCATGPDYDLIVHGGTIYDGSGRPGGGAGIHQHVELVERIAADRWPRPGRTAWRGAAGAPAASQEQD